MATQMILIGPVGAALFKARVCIKPNRRRLVEERDDNEVYKYRDRIEHNFGRLQRCRRVTMWQEQKADSSAGSIWLAALITDNL